VALEEDHDLAVPGDDRLPAAPRDGADDLPGGPGRRIANSNTSPRPAPRAAGLQDPQGTPWPPGPSAAHRPALARLPR
jgi:hypothetical protein